MTMPDDFQIPTGEVQRRSALNLIRYALAHCRIALIGEAHVGRMFGLIYGTETILGEERLRTFVSQVGAMENNVSRLFFADAVCALYRERLTNGLRLVVFEMDEQYQIQMLRELGQTVLDYDEYIRAGNIPSDIRHRKAYWYAQLMQSDFGVTQRQAFEIIARSCDDTELAIVAIDNNRSNLRNLRWGESRRDLDAERDRRMAETVKQLLSGRLAGRTIVSRDGRTRRTEGEIARGGKAIGLFGMLHVAKSSNYGTPTNPPPSSPFAVCLSDGENAIPLNQVFSLACTFEGDAPPVLTSSTGLTRYQTWVLGERGVVSVSNLLSPTPVPLDDFLTRVYDFLRAYFLDPNLGVFITPAIDALHTSSANPPSTIYDAVLYFRDLNRWSPVLGSSPSREHESRYRDLIPLRLTDVFPRVRQVGQVAHITGYGFSRRTAVQAPWLLRMAGRSTEVTVQRLLVANDSLMGFTIPVGLEPGSYTLTLYRGVNQGQRVLAESAILESAIVVR